MCRVNCENEITVNLISHCVWSMCMQEQDDTSREPQIGYVRWLCTLTAYKIYMAIVLSTTRAHSFHSLLEVVTGRSGDQWRAQAKGQMFDSREVAALQ